MAIFKGPTPKPEVGGLPQPSTPPKPEPGPAHESAYPAMARPPVPAMPAPKPVAAQTSVAPDGHESLIASDLSIEGKIQGTGQLRIAGHFKGEVQVDGDLTLESGARLDGDVRACKVVIAGELEGNVESASQVELLESGVVRGDITAGTVTIASGARMRGHVAFGGESPDAARSTDEDEAAPKHSADA